MKKFNDWGYASEQALQTYCELERINIMTWTL